jgi:hypothetical protein
MTYSYTQISQYLSLDAICRSNSLGQLPGGTTLSLMSMPSADSTARAAYSSGRPLRADTRKSLRGCPLWIRNWFATPG